MTANRLQFQPGMSLPEFLGCFGSEAPSAQPLKAARWRGVFRGPRRNNSDAHYVVGHGARPLFQCKGWRHRNPLSAGSLMEHT